MNTPARSWAAQEPWEIKATTPALFVIPFGLLFAAAGAAVFAATVGLIPTMDSSFREASLVLGSVGPLFFGVGLFVAAMGLRPLLHRQRLARNRRNFPNQPALGDYFWEPKGESQNRLHKWIQSFLAALAMTAFLIPFNWWAFFSRDGVFLVKIIVGLFDLMLVACWWGAFYTLVWALKFGPARLTWDSFPIRRDTVVLRWEPGRGLDRWTRGTFTLRCVRERIEKVQSGNETTLSTIHECLWEEVREIDGVRGPLGRGDVNLAFTLSKDAPMTTISAEQPVYWELEVKIPQPGVDFNHIYLVPIYA